MRKKSHAHLARSDRIDATATPFLTTNRIMMKFLVDPRFRKCFRKIFHQLGGNAILAGCSQCRRRLKPYPVCFSSLAPFFLETSRPDEIAALQQADVSFPRREMKMICVSRIEGIAREGEHFFFLNYNFESKFK